VPGSDLIYQNKYKLFTVGAIGTFMATLDGSILNVALPTIADYLHVSVDVVAWVVLAYSLTLISLMLAFGAWAGQRGYSFAYRFGFVLFILGSGSCAFSHDIYQLIIARVIQATGTAMFAAIGPGMITTIFPPNERGKGMGLIVMMVSAGFMIGPPLGGFLLSVWPWQSIFLINIPIGFVGLYMTYRYFGLMPIPTSHRKIPLKGAASISIALVLGTLALTLLNDYSISDIRIWGTASVSLIAAIAFLRFESNGHTAMIGLSIFKNRQFTTAIGAMVFMFIATSGVLLLIPFYLQEIKLFLPRQVGMFLIILPIMMFIMAPLSGRYSDKIGYRLLTSAGVIVLGAGLFILAGLQVDSTNWYIIGALVVVGAGVGLFSTPNSSALMGSVTEEQRAVTSGILGTTRNIGMSIGVALCTSLFSYFKAHKALEMGKNAAFIFSYHRVIYIAAIFAAVSLIFCLTRRNRLQPATK
jgi:EmrB/QacA subfamily drug resistance transporter